MESPQDLNLSIRGDVHKSFKHGFHLWLLRQAEYLAALFHADQEWNLINSAKRTSQMRKNFLWLHQTLNVVAKLN